MRPRTRVAVAVACLAPLLAACGADGNADAGPTGAVVQGSGTVPVTGESSWVQLPVGRVEFQVSEPGTVDEDAVVDPDQLDPDATYVGVSWTHTPGAGIPGDLGGFFVENDVPAPVSMTVDGATHELGEAYPVPGGTAAPNTAYVEVDGDVAPEDLELQVEFADVSQSVTADGSARDAGRAQGIYDLPERSTPAACTPELSPASVKGKPTCAVASVELPYLTGQGWAPEGQAWTVVDVGAQLGEITVDGDPETVVALPGTITLDGAEPDAVLVDDELDGAMHTQTGHLTDADAPLRLEIVRQVETGAGNPAGVTLRASVSLATGSQG